MRIRWSALLKGGGVMLAVLLAMRLGPALLEPGQPPPLAADVGLSPAGAITPGALPARRPAALIGIAPARPLGGNRRRRRPQSRRLRPHPRRRPARRSATLPTTLPTATSPGSPPPPEPPPPPTPTAPPPYSAPPPAPSDGSIEFAPH